MRKEQNANSVMILMWDARWRRRIYMRIVERINYKVVFFTFTFSQLGFLNFTMIIDTMDTWDEEKLRSVVLSKAGNPRTTTDVSS